MLFCLYIPILYAINFLVILPKNSLALLMFLIMLVISFTLFITFAFLWRLVLKIIYSKLAESFAIKGIKEVSKAWLIASIALFFAFLFDGRLWQNPEILLARNSTYLTQVAIDAMGKISAIWLFISSLIYWTLSR
ncbi:MAG: hypothetical protein DCE90_17965 [Pseudanabaena sp.]|nr:MAG: hypothetical protein DCE90_17965 [Pseudanabaena sp.]